MKIKVVLFIIIGVICVSCITYASIKVVRFLLADFYLVTTLKVNDNRKILIYRPSFEEIGKIFFYEVSDENKVSTDKRIFYYSSFDKKQRFILLLSKINGIVGVVDDAYPDSILIMHDFSTGESWPAQKDAASLEDLDSMNIYFKEKLQNAFPEEKLSLNTEKSNG